MGADVIANCPECYFFESFGNVAGVERGRCRRHAPRVIFVGEDDAERDTVWPMVFEDDWCGEFKRDVSVSESVKDT